MDAKIIGRVLLALGSLPEAREDRGQWCGKGARCEVALPKSIRSGHRPFSGQVAEMFGPGSCILACGVVRVERVHGFASAG